MKFYCFQFHVNPAIRSKVIDLFSKSFILTHYGRQSKIGIELLKCHSLLSSQGGRSERIVGGSKKVISKGKLNHF